jgi:hypothetical protein
MMRPLVCALVAAVLWTQAGCSSPEKPAAAPAKTVAARPPDPVRINQFYASHATYHPGETDLLCYGVENARAVWLSPPRHQISAAYSHCLEIAPKTATTYVLTAEGQDGKTAMRRFTVAVGTAPPPAGPRARIVDVTVSALSVGAGQPVSICYTVENSTEVRIEPIHYSAAKSHDCAVAQPRQTTTYTVTAKGASGQDTERVTVAVQ